MPDEPTTPPRCATVETSQVAKLERAVQLRDQFIALLSHELRNPLMGLLTAAELLEHDAELGREARARVCRVIGRQTQQMARIMDDLLDTTRIIRGQVEVHRERIDLRDIVPGSLDALREAAAEASLRLDVSLPDEPLWVDADLARLQQAATNLLGNAIKFTPDGGRIRFALTREHGNGVIMVADSGCGMTPEVIEVIFDPFTRGPAPLRKSSASMGMGLALVRSIATALGGEICAQSNGPDQGSTFEVRIPLVA